MLGILPKSKQDHTYSKGYFSFYSSTLFKNQCNANVFYAKKEGMKKATCNICAIEESFSMKRNSYKAFTKCTKH